MGREEDADRLIHLGSLYSMELRDDPPLGELSPVPPARPGDSRTEQQRVLGSATDDKIVSRANFAKSFGLSIDNVRAVAAQAAHLVDTGGHSLVETVASAVHNSWQQHAVSAAQNGRKTTVSCYRTAVMAYCGWAAEKYGDEAVIFPVSLTAAVTFLEAERLRRVLPRKRRHSEEDTAGGGAAAARTMGKNRRADGADGRATTMGRGRGRGTGEGR
ncbi:hypothetical protein BU14_0626s0010 [Porphyra umbilicalis]|uniref:Uncharacterized protein n=1 Tax=Porphyra umbilicalis TaxID=2786 RepID=A0A1X6NQV1_PORUM|nr:hypothetical protein BU14_0626s0010 [Porphyra umbilicalis]|eukprot:OSX70942.1 hypothetical protein BU14_0626s0010 [Porphyra umbilicalis]